jgi:hypothetical protein
MVGPLRGIIDVLHDGTASVPQNLYKYGHIEDDKRILYTRKTLEDNDLYFSSPHGLNDPFDSAMKCIAKGSKAACKLLFRQWLQRRPDLKRRKHLDFEKQFFRKSRWREELVKGLEEEIMAKRREFGVFCMTRKKDDILMWAHYAANHKGFCLEFQTDNIFFARAREVRYGRRLAQVNLLSPWDSLIEHAAAALLTKSEDWRYEEEWRIVDLDSGVGVQKCPPEAISSVILGCRMSSGKREQIRDWCTSRKPKPMFYEARIKDGEFGLDLIPLAY